MRKLTISLLIVFAGVCSFAQNMSILATIECHNEKPTSIVANSSTPLDSIVYWNWDLDNDGDYNDGVEGKIIKHYFDSAGIIPVSLKVITLDGTEYVYDSSIVVNPKPEANFLVDNLCEGNSATFENLSTISSGTIEKYYWDFNNDGITDQVTEDYTMFNIGVDSTFITKLTVESDKGCVDFTKETTTVFKKPTAKLAFDGVCVGSPTTFINKSTIEDDLLNTCLWDLGDGKTLISVDDFDYTYDEEGTYDISIIAISLNTCRDTFNTKITINSLPEVYLSNEDDTVIIKGNSLDVSVIGEYDSLRWSTGSIDDVLNISSTGEFSVDVVDRNDCIKNLSTSILVKEPEDIEIRNDVMTPNGDGVNDYFVVNNIEKYNSIELVIYNKWGAEVFRTENYNNDWDGKFDNELLDAGTYFYFLNVDGNETNGSINILR